MSVEARDGTRLRVRPIEPWDKDLLRRTLERMSDDSRYRRFFAPVGTVREADLAYLTEVDHHDHEALVALEPETGDAIGVARFVRNADDPRSAEVAVAVVDDWQAHGIGRGLLEMLADRAREENVTHFTALVQGDNRAAIDVLSKLGVTERMNAGPDTQLVIELPVDSGLGAGLAASLRAAAAKAIDAVPLAERLRRLRP